MKENGRLTIPTDIDIIDETLNAARFLGADALRDADGTAFPPELINSGLKIYKTYYTTRDDNAWAKANPDEAQQCYITTAFRASEGDTLSITLLEGLSREMLSVNTACDIKKWWEVFDRTEGQAVPVNLWRYDAAGGFVTIKQTKPYHEYSVSFLAYIVWDPVHMYNSVVNGWDDADKQMTFDVRLPKTKEYSKKRLRAFLDANPHVNVVRFTTFFHQFTLLFDELRQQRYVDWYGYTMSVSPYILERFEKEMGYPFRPEFIIDQGYYNNQYRVPSKEYIDFCGFQRKEVCALAKVLVDIVHAYGREAMMFLGDHFIGVEPYMEEFKSIGLDAVVGSVGNGQTLRLLSGIKGVKYTEGRLLPYFFPDTFNEGANPKAIAMDNQLAARRAILREPIDRIGYGGYLKLALKFPDFMDYIRHAAEEFRDIHKKTRTAPLCLAKVSVLNAWGKSRSWGCHMVHHGLYHKENYSFAGVIEILSGCAFDVSFISFDDILRDGDMLKDTDVLINIGGEGQAHTGGAYWSNPRVVSLIREFIAKGGGFIGIGEPSACQYQGRYFQLADALGVEMERGFTLGYAKPNQDAAPHFITDNMADNIDFGEGKKDIYATNAEILFKSADGVQMAANAYFSGRTVYISGLPYNPTNARVLHKAVLWASGKEENLYDYYSENPNTELNVYPAENLLCVVNNTNKPQETVVYANGKGFTLRLEGGGIWWGTNISTPSSPPPIAL